MRTQTLALFTLFSSMACGGDDSDPTAEPDAGDLAADASEVDSTAPTIVSTAPVDGAVGQLDTATVTITFSEAMDQDSVEGTLNTSELGAVEMQWNGAGDTLTITPTNKLTYASGTGLPADVTAESYSVVLGNAAKDLAGNDLGSGASITFDTLKSMGITLSADNALSKTVTPTEILFADDDPFVVGDDDSDGGMRSVVTFDISSIPDGAHSIAEGTFATRQQLGDLSGSPFADLGTVLLDHVIYADLATENAINAAFNSSQAALSTVGTMFTEGQVVIELDVSAQLADDLANRAARSNRSQYLGRFTTQSDVDGNTDRAVFSRDLLEFQVIYLHE